MDDIAAQLRERLSDQSIRRDEPMKAHTSFRVGGPADLFVSPRSISELAFVLQTCQRFAITPTVIGNGTNLLVSDRGIRGVVVEIGDNLSAVSVSGEEITAQAGISLAKLAATALRHQLSGLEFASGIPGTLGGAVAMNAGAYGGEMKDVVTSVDCLDLGGKELGLCSQEMAFGYRQSIVQSKGYIVVQATLRLQRDNYETIKAKMLDLNARRRAKQPLHLPSAGSVFKRPPGHFAGKLIEDAGLKGFRIGDAQVSEMHSGFIVNLGAATATDILAVIRHVQGEVKRQFQVDLETEVRIVGDW
ncbi:MAG: UDP-N-acetylmuramate dehydrogenase [Firmicutes bacterium]|nr:UDP-N-acetylmuramate dehydrogenase [Bacillota bacterium]